MLVVLRVKKLLHIHGGAFVFSFHFNRKIALNYG
jgi:hypothetical protein